MSAKPRMIHVNGSPVVGNVPVGGTGVAVAVLPLNDGVIVAGGGAGADVEMGGTDVAVATGGGEVGVREGIAVAVRVKVGVRVGVDVAVRVEVAV